MGTRSCVIVKVRKSDLGKTIKFDEAKLPEGVKLEEWTYIDPVTNKIWHDERGEDLTMPVTLNDNYIGIYCHWDGYIHGGVGEALKEKFKTYEDALNLVSGGFCSSIEENMVKHYADRKGEIWPNINPVQGKTQKSVYKKFWDGEYIYLFDEERGGWLYKKPWNAKGGFKHYLETK